VVASRAGLTLGSKLNPTHAVEPDGDKHDAFEVVGVLAPTGTANDRAIFINMEGFYLQEGHAKAKDDVAPGATASLPAAEADDADHDHADHDHDELTPLPEDQREVTSILIRCPEPFMAPMAIENAINRRNDLPIKAVKPIAVVAQLKSSFLAPVRMILLVLTVLIVVVAGISILVSIYNSMSERGHDIAVMRALGASRVAVMGIILLESILLSLAGGLAGLALGHAVLAAAAPTVVSYTGVIVRAWRATPQELWLVPALVAFAAVVGMLPALTAYRTDVAKTLGGAR
jgi:putative ABC transport system permease protein